MRKFSGGLLGLRSLSMILLALLTLGAMIAASGWIGHHSHSTNSSRFFAPGGDAMYLPRVMLWAWERPEDLQFLNPRTTGVAFLAGTIEIRSLAAGSAASAETSVVMHPRLQPLLVPPATALMAVVRVETPNDLWHRPGAAGDGPSDEPGEHLRAGGSSSSATAPYSDDQRERVAEMIASVAAIRGVRAVQVDYDATRSERSFYRKLLEDVRDRLPRGMPLSMTALASWCIGDTWLNLLPVGTIDEAVPMLFRMGPDATNVAAFVRQGNPFRAQACRASLGVSTDEAFSQSLLEGKLKPFAGGRNPRRVYVFSNRAWTSAGVKQIVAEVSKWDAESPESR
jgi:hypothetical protein